MDNDREHTLILQSPDIEELKIVFQGSSMFGINLKLYINETLIEPALENATERNIEKFLVGKLKEKKGLKQLDQKPAELLPYPYNSEVESYQEHVNRTSQIL
tara:strand:+ start:1586 stop:1891 length:306 start_codon:yes stop_codon:yes gene_type:complete